MKNLLVVLILLAFGFTAAPLYAEQKAQEADKLVFQGNSFLEDRDPDGAAIYFYKALALNKNHPGALTGLGEVERLGGNYHEAEEFYIRALALDSNQALTYRGLGLIRYDRGKRDASVTDYFKRAIELNPKDVELEVFQAQIFHDLNNQDEMGKYAKMALRKVPRCYDAV